MKVTNGMATEKRTKLDLTLHSECHQAVEDATLLFN